VNAKAVHNMAAQTARGSDEAAERIAAARVLIRPLREPTAIRAILEPRRAYAAYAIGQLAPRLFPFVRCWYGESERGEGLVMHSGGGLGEAMFTMGHRDTVGAILRLHRGPHATFATAQPEHMPALERFFRVTQQTVMARMHVSTATFEPAMVTDGHVRILRLRSSEARAVNRLYNTEGAPTVYSAAHIDGGYYHGVYYDGRLVAVAGTHVVAPEEGVAVVGNVFTHPRYRGRGYGTLATGAATAALLRECRDVVLTVDPKNIPAVRAYWRLGYTEVCRLIEAPVTRRDSFGLGAAIQRTFARWRGRGLGAEIVRE
jgi:RimJ/RimL family protein N-acetyltransferase